jgi:hypothetical protein
MTRGQFAGEIAAQKLVGTTQQKFTFSKTKRGFSYTFFRAMLLSA